MIFRQSLPEDAGSYFNEETRVLEVPVTILVVDKVSDFFIMLALRLTTDLSYCSDCSLNT